MDGPKTDRCARLPRCNRVVAGVVLQIVAELALGLGNWLRFLVMRKSVKRRMRAALTRWRARATGACLAALALVCASCGTTESVGEIGRTIGEIVNSDFSFREPVGTAEEIVTSPRSFEGAVSVFDETILQYGDASAILNTLGEVSSSSDDGLIWTINEILRS